MSRQGLLRDRLSDFWGSLNSEQRVCWHFESQRNPITLENGDLWTRNGWQWFVTANAPIGVVDETQMLTDPPATNTQPSPLEIQTTAWKLPAKYNAAPSRQTPAPLINVRTVTGTAPHAIFMQSYTKYRGTHTADPQTQRITALTTTTQTWITTGTPPDYLTLTNESGLRTDSPKINKKPSVRHVTVWKAGDPTLFPSDVPTGYFATTAGDNKFATVKGKSARRRPDLPLMKVALINPTSSQIATHTVPNPTGGSRSKIRRPRHYP